MYVSYLPQFIGPPIFFLYSSHFSELILLMRRKENSIKRDYKVSNMKYEHCIFQVGMYVVNCNGIYTYIKWYSSRITLMNENIPKKKFRLFFFFFCRVVDIVMNSVKYNSWYIYMYTHIYNTLCCIVINNVFTLTSFSWTVWYIQLQTVHSDSQLNVYCYGTSSIKCCNVKL